MVWKFPLWTQRVFCLLFDASRFSSSSHLLWWFLMASIPLNYLHPMMPQQYQKVRGSWFIHDIHVVLACMSILKDLLSEWRQEQFCDWTLQGRRTGIFPQEVKEISANTKFAFGNREWFWRHLRKNLQKEEVRKRLGRGTTFESAQEEERFGSLRV